MDKQENKQNEYIDKYYFEEGEYFDDFVGKSEDLTIAIINYIMFLKRKNPDIKSGQARKLVDVNFPGITTKYFLTIHQYRRIDMETFGVCGPLIRQMFKYPIDGDYIFSRAHLMKGTAFNVGAFTFDIKLDI